MEGDLRDNTKASKSNFLLTLGHSEKYGEIIMKILKGDIFDLHLDNQMPRIGSGFRIVEVVSFGWKWVKVKTIHPDERLVFKQRVSRKVWDKIKKSRTFRGEK
ncbi:MAG: hypothetical protein Unbinned3329contig1000_7 [Prokaryotic dsDNA virus sp.]|nr:MAG: hypothetical protein Unbinned3329contig1000_7 [Prokaryotic dsDNA virus sp.]